jgi:acyl-homoserine-lactone acylase
MNRRGFWILFYLEINLPMKKYIFLFLVLFVSGTLAAQPFTKEEINRWQKQATRVTIIRDQWGIPHIYGKTDADAVFGFLYAQCEDDFDRVELNYINAVARLAEVEGESKLYQDLRMRLYYDSAQAILIYNQSPAWLKKLCNAFADGVNYYLHSHPQTKPKLLHRFQPWMPLLFSEGSIGGDVETISVKGLKDFYGTGNSLSENDEPDRSDPEPRGSNGFAIAPSKSASGHAMLLINPHTSFYFRPEVHVVSEQGLNAYGAVTWGQFFIYQGFNEHCGWMHTSSEADAIDEYKETIIRRNDSLYYQYGKEVKPVRSKKIRLAFKDGDKVSYREFTAYYTHHGPVVAKQGDQWITTRLMQEPLKALTQSYMRTKAKDLISFEKTMDLKTNSSNNTVFADGKGNIAYWHGNFIPKRDPQFDWSAPVDGSNPAAEWNGLHTVNESVHIYNPANGWIQNCNSTPFTVAGENSPDKSRYPFYMAPDAENARGINAVRVLKRENSFTLDKLISAAYDPHLAGFEELIPSLVIAYEKVSRLDDDIISKLDEPMSLLRNWDMNCGVSSVPATLAMYWGQELGAKVMPDIPAGTDQLSIIQYMISKTSQEEKVTALDHVINELERDFGTWKMPWGEVNRFQRLTGKITETFDDTKPSLAVPFASSFWGSLAAFGSRKYPGTKKMYGSVGNSFVAVVEFGKEVKAKSILAGGVNNNPSSPHFTDQAERYSRGKFKDVSFYKKDVVKNATRTYNPGK